MNGVTRAGTTLLGAAAAGALVWVAAQIDETSTGGYWAVLGILVGAGALLGLGRRAFSASSPPLESLLFLALAFLPLLVVVGWVAVAGQPHGNWFQRHVVAWSADMGIRAPVDDLLRFVAVLAAGLGVVLGSAFAVGTRRRAVEPEVAAPPPPDGEPAASGDRPDGRRTERETTVVGARGRSA